MADLYQRARLLQGLLDTRKAWTGPLYVDVGLTERCNLRCLGCPYHSPHVGRDFWVNKTDIRDMSFEMYLQLCDGLAALGTRQLILQGSGEPLMHDRIEDMIAYAKLRGFHITLLTNGTLLNEGRARALVDAGLDSIKISLWAASAEQYELNYPGSKGEIFDTVVDGLRAMVAAGRGRPAPRVYVSHIITQHNWRQLDAMVDLATSIGIDGLFFSPLFNPRGSLSDFVPDVDQQRRILSWLRSARPRLRAMGLQENVGQCLLRYRTPKPLFHYSPCYIAWFHVRIHHNGVVESCGRCGGKAPFGNLNDASFAEIWNGSAIQAFRRQTMTRQGLARLSDRCECSLCCYIHDIHAVHRYFRWLGPLVLAARPGDAEAIK
jgi:MoaA/NifB/PqqE/SkfB family radical SAM enzyme